MAIEPLDTGPSNAELGRRLDEVSRMVEHGFQSVNLRLDRYVLAEVHSIYVSQTDRNFEAISKRLEAIETDRKAGGRWVVTTVLAIIAILASVGVGVLAIVVK